MLLSQKVDGDSPFVGMSSVFPEVNPLPGSQRQSAFRNRDPEIHRGDGRTHVCRHIVVTFGRVLKEPVAIGNKPFEKAIEIAPHFWIGIFLDQEGSRGVKDVQSEQACLDPALADKLLRLPGEFI